MNFLIVDDEKLELLLLERLIKKNKLVNGTLFMESGMKGAIEVLEAHVVDIMICDIEMPGGSGLQLTKWVRDHNIDTEVIFLTGHANFSYATNALRLEASDYLLKPVKEAELKNAVMKAMGRCGSIHEYGQENTRMIIEEAQNYIKEHCGEELTREKVAEEYHFQPNYFSRVFSDITKMTFREYLNYCRMEKAKKMLLYSNETISRIAADTGYSTTAYFIKQFKEKYGMTPKKYRNIEREMVLRDNVQ